jgi:hypothetical protein
VYIYQSRLLKNNQGDKIMGTSVGTTVFVLGNETKENREVLTFENGQDYGDLPVSAITAYTVQTTRFPYILS